MNLLDLFALLARRWRLTLAALVIAGLVGGFMYLREDVSYESSAVTAILPAEGVKNPTSNPYFGSIAALSELATVLTKVMTTPQMTAEQAGEGVTSYTVENQEGFSDRSAVIYVTAVDTSPQSAQDSAESVINASSDSLAAIQDNSAVPANSRAALFTVIPPGEGTAAGNDRLRSAALGFIVSLIILLAAIAWWDRRQARATVGS